jgi:hypothetical protein
MRLSELVSVVSSVVNAVTVVLLAGITFWYSKSAKRQADSATEQASAAKEQAAFAEESLKALQTQATERGESDRTTVKISIDSAIRTAEFWSDPNDLVTLCVRRAIPENIFLLPTFADAAVECAIRLKAGIAADMAVAFDYLRIAQMRIESMRSTPVAGDNRYHSKYAEEAAQSIASALLKLRGIQSRLN